MGYDTTTKVLTDVYSTLTYVKWVGATIGGLFVSLIPIYIKSILSARGKIAADVDKKLEDHDKERDKVLSTFKQEVNNKLNELKKIVTEGNADVYENIMDTTINLTKKYEELDRRREDNEKEMIRIMSDLKHQILRCDNTPHPQPQPWDGRERRSVPRGS